VPHPNREENAKPVAKLLEAVRGVIERDVGLHLYSQEDLRFTIQSRQRVARALIESGASERETAQALGVNRSTVRRDASRLSGSNRPTRRAENSTQTRASGSNRPTRRRRNGNDELPDINQAGLDEASFFLDLCQGQHIAVIEQFIRYKENAHTSTVNNLRGALEDTIEKLQAYITQLRE
jgi:transposase-like protein